MEDIRTTLNERAKTHGDYPRTAKTSQCVKCVIHNSPNWGQMFFSQTEAVDMIVHKLARIVNGNPNEPDHWRDIIGYAQLALDDIGRMPKQED